MKASACGLAIVALLAVAAPGTTATSPLAPAAPDPSPEMSAVLPASASPQPPADAGWMPAVEASQGTASPGSATALVLPLVPVTPSPEAVRVSAGPRSTGAVALTFDDGYDRARCAAIAQTLRAYGATGTFFVNGNYLKEAPARWQQILGGQAIGNHTRSHRDLTLESDLVVRHQIAHNEALHERILGRPMLKVLRPPYGAHDTRVRRIAGELGYTHTVLWSVDSRDWRASATVRSIIARATGASPGSVILLHCGPSKTPRALPRIIRHYQARGIRLAGLDVVLGLHEVPSIPPLDEAGRPADSAADPSAVPAA